MGASHSQSRHINGDGNGGVPLYRRPSDTRSSSSSSSSGSGSGVVDAKTSHFKNSASSKGAQATNSIDNSAPLTQGSSSTMTVFENDNIWKKAPLLSISNTSSSSSAAGSPAPGSPTNVAQLSPPVAFRRRLPLAHFDINNDASSNNTNTSSSSALSSKASSPVGRKKMDFSTLTLPDHQNHNNHTNHDENRSLLASSPGMHAKNSNSSDFHTIDMAAAPSSTAPHDDSQPQHVSASSDKIQLDSEYEKALSGLIQLVTVVCECPIALVAFEEESRINIRKSIGISPLYEPSIYPLLSHSFFSPCFQAISDLSADERFSHFDCVTHTPYLRAYSSCGIIDYNLRASHSRSISSASIASPSSSSSSASPTTSGVVVGVICAVDTKVRDFTTQQCEALMSISSQISTLLARNTTRKQMHKHAAPSSPPRSSISTAPPLSQLTYDSLLANKNHLNAFRSFLSTEDANELLDFVLDATEYRRECMNEFSHINASDSDSYKIVYNRMVTAAISLYTLYLSPSSNHKLLSASIHPNILTQLHDMFTSLTECVPQGSDMNYADSPFSPRISPRVFDDAVTNVHDYLRRDLFNRFLSSNHAKGCVEKYK